MDPISASALAALVGGAGGEAGRQLWQSLAALVRRPFSDDAPEPSPTLQLSTAEPELTALQNATGDPARAQALATALANRAAADAEFRRNLEEWWQRARPLATSSGNVHNNISGGAHYAPVLQGPRLLRGYVLYTAGRASQRKLRSACYASRP
ncbi:hypothetical protein [Streptomyces mobaraensis]|uniref:hypothetical protein n=1 Tax=Streptomyces mobaraensis TaxID=35621 RepID=UPI001F0469E4|nr:hypothetical protein [Streptomyces mobaraensis]